MRFRKIYPKVLFLIFIVAFLSGCDDDSKDVKPDETDVKPDETDVKPDETDSLDSPEKLSEYLSGSRYLSKADHLPLGWGPDDELYYGKWSIQFGADTFANFSWDYVEHGTFSYLSKNTILVEVGNTSFSSTIDLSTSELEWNGTTYVRSIE
ncbi:MAG: hypothetical protein HRU20_16340 [Pseudomonadales bacterium]|nr:hypothetical protein [Pseudomonadales bacterium]